MSTLKSKVDLIDSLLLWCIVTGVSWFLCFMFALIITRGILLTENVHLTLVFVLAGALLGLGQWFFLRPVVRHVGLWTFASSIGLSLSLMLMSSILQTTNSFFSMVAAGLLGGLIIGLGQGLTLHPTAGDRLSWIVKTTIGWGAAGAIGISLYQNDFNESAIPVIMIAQLWGIGGAIISILAVFALVALVSKQPERDFRQSVKWWF